jgi:hypothetical protein
MQNLISVFLASLGYTRWKELISYIAGLQWDYAALEYSVRKAKLNYTRTSSYAHRVGYSRSGYTFTEHKVEYF